MRRIHVVAIPLLAALLGGCASAPTDTTGAAPAPTSSATAVAELRVGLIEWTVSVDAEVVPPGQIAVHVTNAGASRHRLVVETADERWESPLLDPGATHTLTIEVEAGETLRIGCDVRGHDAHAPRDLVRVE